MMSAVLRGESMPTLIFLDMASPLLWRRDAAPRDEKAHCL